MPIAKDYSKTWMYYIQIGDKRYYGHSTNEYVSHYLSTHRSKYRQAIRNNKITRQLHKDMFAINMKPEDINLTLIEYYKCNDVNEARKRERELLESYEKSLLSNVRVPSRDIKEWCEVCKEYHKQYYETNKEHILERVKEYNEANKERITEQQKQPFECACGSIIRYDNKARHEKSKRHLQWLKQS